MCADGFEWGCGYGVEGTAPTQSYVSFEGILLLVAVAYCCKGYFIGVTSSYGLFGNDYDSHADIEIYWDDNNDNEILHPTLDVRRVKYVKEQIVTKRVITCQQHNNSTDTDNNKVNQACAICLEEFKRNDLVSWSKQNNKCNHVYHYRCILPWIVHYPTCPCCRCDFVSYPTSTADKIISSYFFKSKIMDEEIENKKNEREHLRFCIKHGLTNCCYDNNDDNDNENCVICD